MQDLRFFELSSFSFRNQTIISWLVVKKHCIPLSFSLLAFLISGVFFRNVLAKEVSLEVAKKTFISL